MRSLWRDKCKTEKRIDESLARSLGILAAQEPKDKPHLVPVRLGGPWEDDGGHWERWRNNELASVGYKEAEYRVRKGQIYLGSCVIKTAEDGDEFRASKDWTGDLPEGCCLATDFVVGQRVRVVPASKYFRSDGKVTKVIETGDGQCATVYWPSDDYTSDYGDGAPHRTGLEGY